MKKYFRILLALVLTLTLFTGAVGIVALAENEPLSGGSGVPPYETSFANTPVFIDYSYSNLSERTVKEWVDITTDANEPVAVTLKTDNGHSAILTFQKIWTKNQRRPYRI